MDLLYNKKEIVMAQYIDKDALVAEIKERIKTYNKGYANGDDSRADALEVLLHDIDTLEMKDVDLDREIRRYRMRNPIIQHREESLYDYMANVAKHFFELGLKARTDKELVEKVYDWLKNYAFVDDEQKVHLPTLLHDFIKDSRTF